MKVIQYKILSAEINHGTEENPDIERILLDKSLACRNQAQFDAGCRIAEKEAVSRITVEGEFDCPTAPRNILAGEYVTCENVLYLALENIPSGERIVVGQNAAETTLEQQLYELKGE